MRTFGMGLALSLFLISGAHSASYEIVLPQPVSVPPVATGTVTRSVTLTRVVADLPAGKIWGRAGGVLLCESTASPSLRWDPTKAELDTAEFDSILQEELSKAGFSAGAASRNLFEEARAGADLQIAVLVKDIESLFCGLKFEDGSHVASGTMRMAIEWQVYDPINREVIGRLQTNTGGAIRRTSDDYVTLALYSAIRENTRQLLADEQFRRLLLAPRNTESPTPASGLTPMSLTRTSGVGGRSVADASGSVVAIFTGDGHGSGFLVSDDGYVLTNHHVVGGSKYVKVRWSDGFETVGEVIRSNKARDVALVKTDPHGRAAMPLRRAGLQPGDSVFAVGAPLDAKFQGTVTKGVVSSTRILDGFSYIQSDVTVNPGNSGGPLLDEKGAVIGITASGFRPAGAPTGINFFIPIGDALDFLNLKPAA